MRFAPILFIFFHSELTLSLRVRVPVHPSPAAPAFSFSPLTFGGDPTGALDSSAALEAALEAATGVSGANALPPAGGSGFVSVDLGGGTYKVSRPLLVRSSASYNLGVIIRGGSLVADKATFAPLGACVIDVQSAATLTIEDVVIDGAHVAGGMRLDNALGVTIQRVQVLHYSSFGILGDDAHGASHELLVTEAFFSEMLWGEPGFDSVAAKNGTAIFLAPQFYDSNFYDIIIRCSRVGVVNFAGANLWHGLHVYSTCNKDPSGGNVSLGFVDAAYGQSRITNCYFDDSPLVILTAHDKIVTDNMFYGFSGLIFAPATQHDAWHGLLVANNIFTPTPYSGANPAMHYDTQNGTIDINNAHAIRVTDNSAFPAQPLATRATVRVMLTGSWSPLQMSNSVLADLRNVLLFMPGGTAHAWDWRAAAGLAISRAVDAAFVGDKSEAPRAPTPAGPYGDGVQTLTAYGVIVNTTDASGAPAPPSSLGLFGLQLLTSVLPTSVAGVFNVSGFPTWFGGDAPNCTACTWTAAVTIAVDQAPPSAAFS